MDLVIYIDYDMLPGLPTEAQEALLKAISVFEAFSARPLAHEQVVAYRRPLTDSEADRVLKIAQDDWVRLSEQYGRARQGPARPFAVHLSRAQRDQRLGHSGEQASDRLAPGSSLMTRETEDGEPILIHINGKAHYPPEEPKPKITRTRLGRYDCRF